MEMYDRFGGKYTEVLFLSAGLKYQDPEISISGHKDKKDRPGQGHGRTT
jgi:hypothetical protein